MKTHRSSKLASEMTLHPTIPLIRYILIYLVQGFYNVNLERMCMSNESRYRLETNRIMLKELYKENRTTK